MTDTARIRELVAKVLDARQDCPVRIDAGSLLQSSCELLETDALALCDRIDALEAENAKYRKVMERCAVIVDRNLYHQHEKIEDVPKLLRAALAAIPSSPAEGGELEQPNAPEPVQVNGVDCFVYPAEQYAAVDADVASERKDGAASAGAVARQMATWAGIRDAANLKWLLEEMLADANRASFRHGQTERALKSLLFALHARPYHGHELLSVEEAIANANDLLDRKHHA